MIVFCVIDMSIVLQYIVRTADRKIELWLIGSYITSVVGLDIRTNRCTEIFLWDGKVPGTIFGYLHEISLGTYVGIYPGPT